MIRLVTCRRLPEPDPDREILSRALERRGVPAQWAAWDDPAVDWSGGLSVLRSTWNYHLDREGFLAWARRAAACGMLANPLEVVEWNSHKGYLLELEARGFPIVPTILLRRSPRPRGEKRRLWELARERGWEDVVVKPAVSAASFGTIRARRSRFRRGRRKGGAPGEGAAGEAHLESLIRDRDMIVQPYVPSVESYGERSLLWIDGRLTHAIRKSPRLAGEAEEVSEAVPIAQEERALAEAVFRRDHGLLYGRLDLVRNAEGRPMIMELELIEPSLFLLQCEPALERLAQAIVRWARKRRS